MLRKRQLVLSQERFCAFRVAGQVLCKSEREFAIGKVARNWTGLKYLALAICTIGLALEREVSRLFSVGEYTPPCWIAPGQRLWKALPIMLTTSYASKHCPKG